MLSVEASAFLASFQTYLSFSHDIWSWTSMYTVLPPLHPPPPPDTPMDQHTGTNKTPWAAKNVFSNVSSHFLKRFTDVFIPGQINPLKNVPNWIVNVQWNVPWIFFEVLENVPNENDVNWQNQPIEISFEQDFDLRKKLISRNVALLC